MLDLNAVLRDLEHTWRDLARDKWKLEVVRLDLAGGPLWIAGDVSHLQQAVENLLFNARDATFEMRNHLRDAARAATELDDAARRQALIAAAAWQRPRGAADAARGRARSSWRCSDNGAGMTEEVRRRCTETHFSTKRDNAIYEGHSTGMGLGLSFVVADPGAPPGEAGDRVGAAEGDDVPGALPGGRAAPGGRGPGRAGGARGGWPGLTGGSLSVAPAQTGMSVPPGGVGGTDIPVCAGAGRTTLPDRLPLQAEVGQLLALGEDLPGRAGVGLDDLVERLAGGVRHLLAGGVAAQLGAGRQLPAAVDVRVARRQLLAHPAQHRLVLVEVGDLLLQPARTRS